MAFEVGRYKTPIGQFYAASANIKVIDCPGLTVTILIIDFLKLQLYWFYSFVDFFLKENCISIEFNSGSKFSI